MYRFKLLSVALLACLLLSACQKEEDETLVTKGNPDTELPIDEPGTDPGDGDTPTPPEPIPPPRDSFSVTISWDIPNERESGEDLLLSEIGGYEIAYKRTVDDSYTIRIITDQNQQQESLEDLPAGHYEFLIAAFDSLGIYSDYSDPTFADVGI